METPLQVTFRGFKHTPELDHFIREQAAALEPVAGNRMTSCHVVMEEGHEHVTPVFHARIDLSIPDGVIAVNREPHDKRLHTDAFVAVRDAFDIARRQLAAWERRHHGET